MRKSLTTAIAAMALLIVAAAPALAQYPPDAPAVAISDTTVFPGQAFTVTSEGWQPGSEVTFTFFSDPVVLGTALVNANGAFTSQVTIPADATPGPHTLRTSGTSAAGVPANVDLAITVIAVADATTPPPSGAGVTPAPGLPRTGGEALTMLLSAAGLLAVGGAAVAVARRRSGADFGG